MSFNVDSLFIFAILVAAILLDLLMGEFPSPIHPVVWMGNLISKMLEPSERLKGRAKRFIAGMVIVLSGLAVSLLVGGLFTYPLSIYNRNSILTAIALVGCLFLVKSTFSMTALLKAAGSVYRALDAGDLSLARELTSIHLVSRDTSALNGREISAAVIESVSENLTDSVVSPWFFLLTGGPSAALGYRFVNTCDSMLGYRNERFEWLGKFAARADDALNFIPARIAGLLLIAAAVFTRGLSARNAFRTMMRENRVTQSPNAGWTMAAASGALGVRLEKKGCYAISEDLDLPAEADIMKAADLVRTSMLLAFILYAIVLLLSSGMFI